MPRARNIKPSIFLNEILGVSDPLLTVLFTSLWCLADREGRLEDRPERIRIETFPYRLGIKIDELLNELYVKGFINRYEVNGGRYIEVINFGKHQRPHSTEKKSILPPCEAKFLIPKGAGKFNVKSSLLNVGLTVVKRPDSLIPDLLIPDLLIPDSKNIVTARKIPDLDFEEFWQDYPKRPGANKTQALNAWKTRLRQGASIIEMQNGALRYARYCEAMQTEGKYIKQASTFLGPDKHYESEWNVETGAEKFDSWLIGSKGTDDDIIDI